MSGVSNGGDVSGTPSVFFSDPDVTLWHGDALATLRELPNKSVDCCVTSPPYWGLRNYGVVGQLGLEECPEEYVYQLTEVMRELHRVLADHGTLWLNLDDTYWRKELQGIPWQVVFHMRDAGWRLRSDCIWHKTNAMPESASDRPTRAHEYVFLLTKNSWYFFDQEAIREPYTEPLNRWGGSAVTGEEQRRSPRGLAQDRNLRPNAAGRNGRSVWSIPTANYSGAHFAVFPTQLVEKCITAGCVESGTVLDPFAGSGTTLFAARNLGRRAIGVELNPMYCELAAERLAQQNLLAAGSA